MEKIIHELRLLTKIIYFIGRKNSIKQLTSKFSGKRILLYNTIPVLIIKGNVWLHDSKTIKPNFNTKRIKLCACEYLVGMIINPRNNHSTILERYLRMGLTKKIQIFYTTNENNTEVSYFN